MKTIQQNNRPVLSQTENNATLWIGHLQTETNDHLGGQTFLCPSEGLVNNIQVYSSSVQQPGDMALTLHEFDPSGKTWGPVIGESSISLQKGEDSRWVRFNLQPVSLKKDAMYGFRLESPNAMIGIGEAASRASQPFIFGNEWCADSKNESGNYFTYFSLAFKVEMCA